MKHPIIDGHASIAWDMDGTLVDGPNSDFFRRYILAHPEKRHVVITFRTPRAWAEDIYRELYPYGITRQHIIAVHNVDDHLYHAYAQRHSFPQPEMIAAYLAFKATKAKEIGASILIDDLPEQVREACDAYGIVFLDAFAACPIITGGRSNG